MNRHLVYTPEADKMWFGILVGNPDIEDLRDVEFHIGTLNDVYQTMDALDPTKEATNCLRGMGPRICYLALKILYPWSLHGCANRTPGSIGFPM